MDGTRAQYWRDLHELENKVDDLDQYDPRRRPQPPRVDEYIAPSYVTVSYDSDLEQFTVTVTDLPVAWIHGTQADQDWLEADDFRYPVNETLTETLVFDKPTSGFNNISIRLSPVKDKYLADSVSGSITWVSSNATASNADTANREISGGSQITLISIDSTGVSSMKEIPAVPVVGGFGQDQPYVIVNTSTKKIYLRNCRDPLDFADQISGNGYSYSEPTNLALIIGWNNGDFSVTLDSSVNTGSYDNWYYIAVVNIDSANVVTKAEVINYNHHLTVPHIGFTGTGSYTNFVIRNGIIVNAT